MSNHHLEAATVVSKPAPVLAYKVSVLQDIEVVRDKQELGLNLPICHLSGESLSHWGATTAEG